MKSQNNHIEPIDLIIKSFSASLTPEEKALLEDWLKEDSLHREMIDEYRRVWEGMDHVKGITSDDIQKEWIRLEKAIEKKPFTSSNAPKTISLVHRFSRIAAVLLIFIFSAASVFVIRNMLRKEKIHTELAVKDVGLSDGSKVTLNSHTLLVYPDKFQKTERVVKLKGEAFFEVTPDAEKPFKVKTGNLMIEVIGTSFNVNAYEENDQVEIVVNSGKVAFYKEHAKTDGIEIEAGMKGEYYRSTGKLVKIANDDTNFQAWRTRSFIFEDKPLEQVVEAINQVYHSRITIVSEEIKTCRISVTFENQSLSSIIEILASTLDLTVTKNGQTIGLRGEGC